MLLIPGLVQKFKWWLIAWLSILILGSTFWEQLVEFQSFVRKLHNVNSNTNTLATVVKYIDNFSFLPKTEGVPTAEKNKWADFIETTLDKSPKSSEDKSGRIIKDQDVVLDVSLSDDEIKNIQNKLIKRLAIKNPKEIDPERFRSILSDMFEDDIKEPKHQTRIFGSLFSYCTLCKQVVKSIQSYGMGVVKAAQYVCKIYMMISTLHWSDFCKEYVDLNTPVLEYVFNNSKILDPELACSIILYTRDCYYFKPALSWSLDDNHTSPVYPSEKRNFLHPNKKPLKILHITDPHISWDYEVNGAVSCGYPLCCKKGLGQKTKGDAAGYWGTYKCDIPPWLYTTTLQYISNTHRDIDYIYFTGDIVDHMIWNTSIPAESELIKFAFTTLQQIFPKTPVFSVLGNHDSHLVNMFPPNSEELAAKGFSLNWMYDLMAEVWSPWLPPNALKTVRRQGYYAYSVNKKFKIIGLNNNICVNFNLWLLLDTEFLKEQLEFLVQQLEESEKRGQFVHILSHVPVGTNECVKPWESNFNKIIERYSHIIKGQFIGHTHTDELKIFYDRFKNPINVAFNGASLTPHLDYNPNYKIIHVDPDTLDLLDIETFYFNLTEANLYPNRTPAWKKLYSMKEAYSLPDLSPKSFDAFANSLFTNKTILDIYWKNYIRLGDESLKTGCDNDCLHQIRCNMVTTNSFYPAKERCYDE